MKENESKIHLKIYSLTVDKFSIKLKCAMLGVPGWFSQLGICLLLRS